MTKATTATEVRALPIDNGIAEADREAIASALSRLLADTHVLYLKTHNYHWNVTGPMFQTLHLMFELHYNELWLATDLLAERIRALGFFAPGTYKEYAKLAAIEEEDGIPSATDMIRLLVRGHDTAARTARAALKISEDASDAPTADLLTQRLNIHEKTAWMLRSLLADNG